MSLSQTINDLLAIAVQKESLPIGIPKGGENEERVFPTSKGAKNVTAALVESIETDA
ncbi:MAG: hypothetical protein ACFCU4_10425 [Puniceicoccaceae bacterium]